MSLRTATLVAIIGVSIGLLIALVNFGINISKSYYAIQYIISMLGTAVFDVTLLIFLGVLYSKQKK